MNQLLAGIKQAVLLAHKQQTCSARYEKGLKVHLCGYCFSITLIIAPQPLLGIQATTLVSGVHYGYISYCWLRCSIEMNLLFLTVLKISDVLMAKRPHI